jgi:arginine decarboxylase
VDRANHPHAAALAVQDPRLLLAWSADCALVAENRSDAALTALLGTTTPGDRVLASRRARLATHAHLTRAGVTPIWVDPTLDPFTDQPAYIPVTAIREALDAQPDITTLLLDDPLTSGGMSDLPYIVDVAHDHDVTVVVDATWSAHFGFHRSLPGHALDAGADILITGAHPARIDLPSTHLVLGRGPRAHLELLVTAHAAVHPLKLSAATLTAAALSVASLTDDLFDPSPLASAVRQARRTVGAAGLGVHHSSEMDPLKLVLHLPASIEPHQVAATLVDAGYPVEHGDNRLLIPTIHWGETTGYVQELTAALLGAVNDARSTTDD